VPTSRRPWRLLLSCEHASNAVPREYAALFRGRRALLATHRGYDLGAHEVARSLARATGAPLFAGRVTRLLVDVNRTPGNPSMFSELTRGLPEEERDALQRRYHTPHWLRVGAAVGELLARGERVAHVGVHSFTPVWNGAPRGIDVGLLYDSARPAERAFCDAWRAALLAREPSLRLRRNAPYRGVSDCLPTALRRRLPPRRYLGLELELCQDLLATPVGRARWARLAAASLADALARA
jgi:predicted N-formylglutamate amidohydrolase